MAGHRNARRGGGRRNAAEARPAEVDRYDSDETRLPLAGSLASGAARDEHGLPVAVPRPAPARPAERGPLEIGFDPGLTDLGDDVTRGAEEGESPAAPARGRLEGGIDAGLTDLGDDGDLPVALDDDERPR